MASMVQHRQGQGMVTEDGFTVADVRLAGLHVPDHNGVEGVAGSVTSFVRKLFQMVQGECDSVVGFVADGTAFEVKDPRRLEQDILPKYFRHSRFQSLVRQLNFYSFKKISKERSVWIYKHAFFRRDEPELLHALKRKTNQHGGARIGDPNADDDVMERPARVMSPRSLPRSSHDSNSNNKPRQRGSISGPCLARNQSNFSMHSPQSSFGRQQQPRLPSSYSKQHPTDHVSSNVRAPERQAVAGSKLQSNPRSGGGPSTGGVGGAAAAPCYGRSSGTGPSPTSSRMPGFGSGWNGETVAGSGGGVAGRSLGSGSARCGEDYDLYSDHRIHAAARALSHSSSNTSRHDLSSPRSDQQKGPFSPQSSRAYRQGPAMGDTFSGGRGVKRDAASSGGGSASSAPGGSSVTSREQALALYGLSALCQVASATAVAGEGNESEASAHNGNGRDDGYDAAVSNRFPGGGRATRPAVFWGGEYRREQKRACTANGVVAPRRPWGYSAGEREGGRESSEEDEDDVEDGITSAERDDSVASSVRSRSESTCGSDRSRTNSVDNKDNVVHVTSPPVGPSRSAAFPGRSRRHPSSANERFSALARITCDDASRTMMRGEAEGPGSKTGSSGGGGGVFCPTWDWGRAATRPAVSTGRTWGSRRSFDDRRSEEKMTVDKEVNTADQRQLEDGQDEDEQSTGREDDGDEGKAEDDESATGVEGQEREHQVRRYASNVRPNQSPVTRVGRRDTQADSLSEAAVGLAGIGALFDQFCVNNDMVVADKSNSIYLATVTNSGDDGLREVAVFCANASAEAEPDTASPAHLAGQVAVFLENEQAVADDLRIYAEALDPAAADVVGGRAGRCARAQPPTPAESTKLLRIFCRYAACRLGRALEVTSAIADGGSSNGVSQSMVEIAQRVSPRLDGCRWKWWRAAVRFS